MYKELNNKILLQKLFDRFDNQYKVAQEIGCSQPAVVAACKRFGIQMKTDGRFKIGRRQENNNSLANLTYRWPIGTQPPKLTTLGYHHSDSAKRAISEHNWSKTEEGKRAISKISKAVWARDNGTRRAKTAERMRELGRASRGKPSHNRLGYFQTCARDACDELVWVSPSREGKRRYCSRSCQWLEKDRTYQENAEKYYRNYDDTFSAEVRKYIWTRDIGKCRWCGIDCTHKNVYGRRTGHVHHLSYDKLDSSPDNLVLLCGHCHMSYHQRNASPIKFLWATPIS